MSPKDVAPFEADRHLRARLRKECTANDGTLVGDVRWWKPAGCLYIYTLLPNGKDWMPRTALIDGNGFPRQITLKDIEDAREMLHEARNVTNSRWWEGVQRHNEEMEAKAFQDAKAEIELAREYAQDKNRRGYCMHEVRVDVDCEMCRIGVGVQAPRKAQPRAKNLDAMYTDNTVTVVDRRRVV